MLDELLFMMDDGMTDGMSWMDSLLCLLIGQTLGLCYGFVPG
jgi:hypothetical protein